MAMSDDTIAEQIRDLVAREEGSINEGADDYAVITVVVEEHEHDVDASGIYKTDFRDDADDATASALAKAVGVTVPQLLLELALEETRNRTAGESHE